MIDSRDAHMTER